MINFKYFGQKHQNTQSSWCYKLNSETPSGQKEKQTSLCIHTTQHGTKSQDANGGGETLRGGGKYITSLCNYTF